MFKQIMVAVDLAHVDQLSKALTVAADMSKYYGAPLCYVGVANAEPGAVAHNPAEFEQKLNAFAEAQGSQHGVETKAHAYTGHDITTDVDDVLLKAVKDVGADLVVMASHIPTLMDYVWPSNGGKIAAHSKAAVFVVR